MPFRLVYLPHVVLRKVFATMDLSDLICLALTSSNSYQLVKFFKRKTLELCMDSFRTKSPEVWFRGSLPVCSLTVQERVEKQELVQIQGSRIPFCRAPRPSRLVFTNNDPVDGLKRLLEFVQDLFRIQVVHLAVVGKDSLWALDWVASRQQSLGEAYIFGKLTVEEYEKVLTRAV